MIEKLRMNSRSMLWGASTQYPTVGRDRSGSYLVQIGAGQDVPVSVIKEECSVKSVRGNDWFKVHGGVVTSNQGVMPAASEEKLYLVNASGLGPFESVYRALSSITV